MNPLQPSEKNLKISSLDRKTLAWLTKKINLTPVKIGQILSLYETINDAVKDNFSKLQDQKMRWAKNWKSVSDLETQMEILEKRLIETDIKFITSFDQVYPDKLKILENYPIVLFYQGDIELLNQNNFVTVVGSRNYAKYAELLIKKILDPVCKSGVGVVSGLAFGIDKLSHESAISNNAKTIGIIGSGLNLEVFYPKDNWNLRNLILEKGGLICSEYAPDTTGTIYTFPARNRILAALSSLTWVVQASKKSGSLITADIAELIGKTVASTPASVLEEGFEGNINLIKNGCSIITESEDIFQLLGLKMHPEINYSLPVVFNSQKEEIVYKSLGKEPLNVEQIMSNCSLNLQEVSVNLTMLEMSGLVLNIGENMWVQS